MTLFPRITTSPIVSPSRGDVVHLPVDDAHRLALVYPMALARQGAPAHSAGSPSQSVPLAHGVGP